VRWRWRGCTQTRGRARGEGKEAAMTGGEGGGEGHGGTSYPRRRVWDRVAPVIDPLSPSSHSSLAEATHLEDLASSYPFSLSRGDGS
jgi:hypothetical protein